MIAATMIYVEERYEKLSHHDTRRRQNSSFTDKTRDYFRPSSAFGLVHETSHYLQHR